jgi:hypothetical protein
MLIMVPRYNAHLSNLLFTQSIIGPMFHLLFVLGMQFGTVPSGIMNIAIDTNIIVHQIKPILITAINGYHGVLFPPYCCLFYHNHWGNQGNKDLFHP